MSAQMIEEVGHAPTGGAPSDVSRARLRADVSRAATLVAPLWPLGSFVAVNPLGGLVGSSFDVATREARRWFGARTHLPIEEHRDAFARGEITLGALHRAMGEVVPELIAGPEVSIGGRTCRALEVLTADLLEGPVATAPERVRPHRWRRSASVLHPDADADVDVYVASWLAAFADEVDGGWAMPDRSSGFFAAWQRGAAHDRRLSRLVGRAQRRWIASLPDTPVDALATALEALGVDEADRVDELRFQLTRLPGWAGYARWCDEWAPADHGGPVLTLFDLLAARVAVEAAAVHGQRVRLVPSGDAGARDGGPDDGALLARRVDAVLVALGSTPEDPAGTPVRALLEDLDEDDRQAIWLAAAERHVRDRLLGLLSRVDPGPSMARPDAQVLCCIDVRSEVLRRHLESVANVETLGVAGFFGVPMRFRPLGSPVSVPRCPVLLTPNHEVVEQPDGDGALADRRLRASRRDGAASHSFHSTLESLGAPFALAESAGWVAGPVAAARTLLPSSASLGGRRASAEVPTRVEVAGEHHDVSGFGLEERTLFAEALLATTCLTRLAPLVVLCGHGAETVNNPHASSLDCGACGGSPGGDSARVAAAILNDPEVRAALAARGRPIPDDTWVVAAQHDTPSDRVTVLDPHLVPDSHRARVADLERALAVAGERTAAERAERLDDRPAAVRRRGQDWAQVRPEWGLAGNAAFLVGPRSLSAGLDLGGRVFLHSYDADADPDGVALESILTAPLVVAQWISAQYYFSTVDPEVFGAGDKTVHNPVGGIGVMRGQVGDLAVGLPSQSVSMGDQRAHDPVRLLALVQAPLVRTEEIIQRNPVLRDLVGGGWIAVAGRSEGHEPWSVRSRSGVWETWFPAGAELDPGRVGASSTGVTT